MKLCVPKYRMSSRMVASTSESETKASGRCAALPWGGTGLAGAQATKTDPSASERASRRLFMGLLREVALSFTGQQGCQGAARGRVVFATCSRRNVNSRNLVVAFHPGRCYMQPGGCV